MPIDIEKAHDISEFPVRPGTNEHEVLEFLTINDELAYTPTELAEETGVNRNSIDKTLGRLQDKGLVEKVERGYYHVNQERYNWIAENVELLHAYQVPGSHGYDESERDLTDEETGELTKETENIVEDIVNKESK